MSQPSAVLVLLVSMLAMPAYSDIGAELIGEGSLRQLTELPQEGGFSGGRELLQNGQRLRRRGQGGRGGAGGRGLLQLGQRLRRGLLQAGQRSKQGRQRKGGRGLLQATVTETYTGPNGRTFMDSFSSGKGNKPASVTVAIKGLQNTQLTKTYTVAKPTAKKQAAAKPPAAAKKPAPAAKKPPAAAKNAPAAANKKVQIININDA